MANKIILISDDSDFFDYIKLKLELRHSDELFSFCFDDVPDKINFLESAVLIINSENTQQKTLDLLKLFSGTPIIVMAYNDDETFKKKCYRAGMLDYIPLLTSDSEFRARMLPALSIASLLEKNRQYRNFLVKNKIISKNNEVYTDYEQIIDTALQEIKETQRKAVFAAISPDNKGKFLIKPNTIETLILGYMRKNDILMNFATDKYYILLYDTDVNAVKKLWNKISSKFPQKIYAGIVAVKDQNRQQLINEALNKLHEEYNTTNIKHSNNISDSTSPYSNFKLFRKEFTQKLEQIVTPVFYAAQQKYMNKFSGVKIEFGINEGYADFLITGKHLTGNFKISCPGFSKVLIDISVKKDSEDADTKRISFEPDELEAGLLSDLLEQFISEIRSMFNKEIL